MLAHRIEGDVAHQHHFLVVLVERRLEVLGRILRQACEHLFVHLGDAFRRLEKPFAIGILPDAFQDEPHACFDFFSVHVMRSFV